jgi:hypothetical protein
MKCFIYRNLHRPGHTYSLRAMEGEHKGRVVGYTQCAIVKDARFIVQQAGRLKVVDTGHKNVHAGIVGEVLEAYMLETRLPTDIRIGVTYISITQPHIEVKYNPYKAPTFYNIKTNEPVHSAELVGIYGPLVEAYSSITALKDRPDLLAASVQGRSLHPSSS